MNIFESISYVMSKIGCIGKNNTNDTQKFKYRGIDDVMNSLNPALIEAHMFVVPEVLTVEREERISSKGANLIYSVARIRYRFFAEDGSSVEAVVVGEGMDSGDKSMNKAMSVAFKYACFQVFCIPTEELMDDPDKESHEVVKKEKVAEISTPGKASEESIANLKSEAQRTGYSDAAVYSWLKVNDYKDLDEYTCAWAIDKLSKAPSAKG